VDVIAVSQKPLEEKFLIKNKEKGGFVKSRREATSTRRTSATVKTAEIADWTDAMNKLTMPISGAFLTIPQAADFLGFKPSYLRKLCFLKQIPHFKPNGGHLLFDRAELEAYVRAGRVASNSELADRADAILNGGL